METPTPFDLNRAIQQWRDGLAQSPAIRRENLDELETHLRDSISTLQTRTLTAEESFLVATKRVGSSVLLGKEFGKVNAVNVWVERCLWALVIMQAWRAMQFIWQASLENVKRFMGGSGIFNINLTKDGSWKTWVLAVAMTAIPLVISALLIWRLLQSPQSRFGSWLEKLSAQPAMFAVTVFLLDMGANLFSTFASHYPTSVGQRLPVALYLMYLPSNLIFACLVFVLARKRLLRKSESC